MTIPAPRAAADTTDAGLRDEIARRAAIQHAAARDQSRYLTDITGDTGHAERFEAAVTARLEQEQEVDA